MNPAPVSHLTTIDPYFFLDHALGLAALASQQGDVPVGAVVVYQGQIIGEGYNQKERRQQAAAHAEMVAIAQACDALASWRLIDCVLVSTLEPCPMCAGALLQARVGAVVYGARDWRWGALETRLQLIDIGFNHRPSLHYVPYPPCETILTDFFKHRRSKGITPPHPSSTQRREDPSYQEDPEADDSKEIRNLGWGSG